MAWTTPKTDWNSALDRFNIDDYNRIKNNLQALYELALELFPFLTIGDMGDDITDYSTFWDVDMFNLFEQNLTDINEGTYNLSIGTQVTFEENGLFISASELNRIESYTLEIYEALNINKAALPTLAFTLGGQKGFKV